MRKYGCEVPGGAEAIIHFRNFLMALARSDKLSGPLCTSDIDQRNFLESLEWEFLGHDVSDAFPKRGAALAWKHTEATLMHRMGATPYRSDRGTDQGDVDAPLEASLAQGGIARKTRGDVYQHLVSDAGALQPSQCDDVTSWRHDVARWSTVQARSTRTAGPDSICSAAASREPRRCGHAHARPNRVASDVGGAFS